MYVYVCMCVCVCIREILVFLFPDPSLGYIWVWGLQYRMLMGIFWDVMGCYGLLYGMHMLGSMK